MPGKPASKTISRRKALGLIAVTAGGGAFLPASAFAQATSPYSGLALFMQGGGVCALTPETTEGPFYFDPELERADITEGRDGIPLSVRLQVVDQNCRPIEKARVDIWHCDAKGHYSGYPGQGDGRDVDTTGEKFLRGWLAHRRRRHRRLQHHLSRLVSRPHHAYSFQGVSRRKIGR